jgi:acetolactate synthase regulatory subunit
MRIRTMTVILLQVASLAACDGAPRFDQSIPTRSATVAGGKDEAKQSADAIAVGAVGERERAANAPATSSEEQWFRPTTADPMDRLILRTGQASIEVDSLEAAMARLRRLAQRAGGFVADAAVQSGRDQVRQATLELKVPSARFDELTEGLQPIGRLEFVNVSAEDVSEEFVDLTARAVNGRKLEERLIELLRTRTGKLQDVLSVERELARVREEIERIEGRLRYLKTSAQLSTLSVSLHEPMPIVATQGRGPIAEAFREAWRNFVGVLAAGIASLGYLVPVVVLGWGIVVVGRRWRKPATV